MVVDSKRETKTQSSVDSGPNAFKSLSSLETASFSLSFFARKSLSDVLEVSPIRAKIHLQYDDICSKKPIEKILFSMQPAHARQIIAVMPKQPPYPTRSDCELHAWASDAISFCQTAFTEINKMRAWGVRNVRPALLLLTDTEIGGIWDTPHLHFQPVLTISVCEELKKEMHKLYQDRLAPLGKTVSKLRDDVKHERREKEEAKRVLQKQNDELAALRQKLQTTRAKLEFYSAKEWDDLSDYVATSLTTTPLSSPSGSVQSEPKPSRSTPVDFLDMCDEI